MRVLLAVDGSEHSHQAAEALSKLSSARSLTVLHVIDLPRLSYGMLGPEVARDFAMTVEQAMREEGEHVLKRTMSHLSYHAAPVKKRLEEGTPAEVILSVAQEEQADLIIVGARGLGKIQELVLGSVSHRVLTHAPCPVLIVNSPLQEVRNILLPIQGPEDMEGARKVLAQRPFHGQAKVTVFTVVPLPRSFLRAGVSAPEGKIKQALESAETCIDNVVGDLKDCPYSVTGVVGMGAPAEVILEQATETNPDLIMMGVHHPSAVSRFLLGSVSHTVLHRASCPLLMIR